MIKMLLATVSLVIGCSGNPDIACDVLQKTSFATTHTCIELRDVASARVPTLQASCEKTGGTLVDACTTTHELGVCSTTQPSETVDQFFYSDDTTDTTAPDRGEVTCQALEGAWTGR
jgi:hypothetical protein